MEISLTTMVPLPSFVHFSGSFQPQQEIVLVQQCGDIRIVFYAVYIPAASSRQLTFSIRVHSNSGSPALAHSTRPHFRLYATRILGRSSLPLRASDNDMGCGMSTPRWGRYESSGRMPRGFYDGTWGGYESDDDWGRPRPSRGNASGGLGGFRDISSYNDYGRSSWRRYR